MKSLFSFWAVINGQLMEFATEEEAEEYKKENCPDDQSEQFSHNQYKNRHYYFTR